MVFIKMAMEFPFISHFVGIKGFYCMPENPKLKFTPITTVDQILYNNYVEFSRAHCRMLAKQTSTDFVFSFEI